MDPEELKQRGFRCGDFEVDPLRLIVRGPNDEVRLQPRVMAVLVALAAAAGRVVTRDALVAQVWEGVVVTDDAVNRCIAELRRVLKSSGQEPVIETVPRVGYRLVPGVTFADRSSTQPAASVESGAAATPQHPGRRVTVAATLLLVVAAIAVSRLTPDRAPTVDPEPVPSSATAHAPPQQSIAVLPFVNLSSDPAQDYVSDGFAEELIDLIARIPGLQVTARTSAFQFRGSAADVREIGERLNVRYLIEGSVRRDGDALRITSQLIDATTGYHVWSRSYDRRFERLLEVQHEIATEVAGQLDAWLTGPLPAAEPRQVVPLAYEHYLRARQQERRNSTDGWLAALKDYREAARVDPQFAAAEAGIARALLHANRAMATDRIEELDQLVVPHLERALALDPTLGDVYVTRGWLRRWTRRDGGDEAYRAAIELDPNNAIAHQSLAALEYQNGRFSRALALARRAHDLDPISAVSHDWVNMLFAAFDRRAELDRSLDRARRLADEDPAAATVYCRGLLRAGAPAEAMACTVKAERKFPDETALVGVAAQAAAILGDRDLLAAQLERLAAAGDREAAFALLALRWDTAGIRRAAAELDRTGLGLREALSLAEAARRVGLNDSVAELLAHAEVAEAALDPARRTWTLMETGLPLLITSMQSQNDRAAAGRYLDLLLEWTARPLLEGAKGPAEHARRAFALALADRIDEAFVELAAAAAAFGMPLDHDAVVAHPAWPHLAGDPRSQALLDRLYVTQAALRARLPAAFEQLGLTWPDDLRASSQTRAVRTREIAPTAP